jgi:hypothetical protein
VCGDSGFGCISLVGGSFTSVDHQASLGVLRAYLAVFQSPASRPFSNCRKVIVHFSGPSLATSCIPAAAAYVNALAEWFILDSGQSFASVSTFDLRFRRNESAPRGLENTVEVYGAVVAGGRRKKGYVNYTDSELHPKMAEPHGLSLIRAGNDLRTKLRPSARTPSHSPPLCSPCSPTVRAGRLSV